MTSVQTTTRKDAMPFEVPAEIRSFLKTDRNVLLVKGSAGAGKTTFALEALRVLTNPASGVYLSSRTSEVMIPRHFPWITKEWRKQVVDASQVLRHVVGHPPKKSNGDTKKPDSGLKELRRFLGGELASRLTPIDVDRFTETDHGIGSGNLVVLDSLEGLAEPLGRDATALFHDFREIAVDDYSANVIVVLEASGPTPLDYLADGIIEMRKERYVNSIIRELHIEKLRGVTIDNPTYLFTLHQGRFRAFSPDRGNRFLAKGPAKSASNGTLSSGIEGLDRILDGGYTWGDTILVETAEDVDDRLLDWFAFTPLNVALQEGHAVYHYPSLGQTARRAQRILTRNMDPKSVEDRLRIATYIDHEDEASELEPYELPLMRQLGDRDGLPSHYDQTFGWIEDVTAGKRKAILAVSWDHAELEYDPRSLEIFAGQAINQVRDEEWLMLLFRKRDRDRPKDNLPKLVKRHLRIDNVQKVPVLTAERPYLGTFGLQEGDQGLEIVPFR